MSFRDVVLAVLVAGFVLFEIWGQRMEKKWWPDA